MNRWAHWSCLFVFVGTLAGGCGYIRSAAIGDLMEQVTRGTQQHDDVDLVMQALPTYLLLLDSLIDADPADVQLLRTAAEGYTSYAILVEVSDEPRAGRLFGRARDYGTAALVARRPAIADLLSGPVSGFGEVTQHLQQSDVPFVFWAASSWGAWINTHTGSMAALADLPKVMLLMQWVLDQDATYRYGSAHVFLGMYHAALPPILGGDPERAHSHFEKALAMANGQDLMAYVQVARFYARQTFDRELYVSLLEHVLTSEVATYPELTLQNAAAQRIARVMLAEIDVYF